jgi:hypothetical protein
MADSLTAIDANLFATDAECGCRRYVIDFDRLDCATRQCELTSPAITLHHSQTHVSWCWWSTP